MPKFQKQIPKGRVPSAEIAQVRLKIQTVQNGNALKKFVYVLYLKWF